MSWSVAVAVVWPPPVSAAHAVGGVLPGLVVGTAVGLALGDALVGAGDGVREAAGVPAADVAGAVVGEGEIRTVSCGVHAARTSEMSRNDAARRVGRPFICLDGRSAAVRCRASKQTDIPDVRDPYATCA
jgi:hypothetical protein